MALPADFSKIFGSTATGGLTPISDVNYAKGWEFVGSNPPTKNDFSYLQNQSDLKAKWLYENKLQLTDPFGDIESAGLVNAALANLKLIGGIKADAVGRLVGCKVFSSSGTYTPTSGTKFIVAELQGGGGGGGGVGTRAASGSLSIGGSGGGGGYGKFLISSLASSYPITVGSGGAAGAASASNNVTTTGSSGGNTTLGSVATATGGAGATNGITVPGLAVVAGRVGGGNATGTGLIQTVYGGNSKYGFSLTGYAGVSGSGGGSYYGDGAQESLSQGDNTSEAGSRAYALGSGGSGAISSGTAAGAAGGVGASGLAIIWEYA